MNRKLFLLLLPLCLLACSFSTMAAESALPTISQQLASTKIQAQTAAPQPTPVCFIVSAETAVYLRETPNTDKYPIMPVLNGTKVTDLGGRDGDWLFVQLGGLRGWINSNYLKGC